MWRYLVVCSSLLHAGLPLAFEANRGQADARFLYLARSANQAVYLSRSGAVLAAPGAPQVEIVFEHGRADAIIEPQNPQAGVSNYFIGRDPKNWRTGIPQFGSVQYRNLYPGIDLIFHGDEFDFDVAPQADPRAIRLRLRGGTPAMTAEGDIAVGAMRLRRPVIYQGETIIPGRFRIDREGLVTFSLSDYDRGRKLTIDPVITWSAYLGNGNTDRFSSLAVDKDGNTYVTGRAVSGFPTANPLQTNHGGVCGTILTVQVQCGDVFVTKLNAAGTALVYSTYIGGSGEDSGMQIGVDAAGNAVVLGTTRSTDFPSTDGALQPVGNGPGLAAFVFKLDPAGSKLLYSTGVQGFPSALAVDTTGNAYIGRENRTATGGAVVIDKLNSQGTALVYSFSFGGGGGEDAPRSLALDSSGAVYVAGVTHSIDFPVSPDALQRTNTAYANFIAKVNPAGTAVVFATYFAGGINAIAAGPGGDVFVSGIVVDGFQTTPKAAESVFGGSLGDAFAARLNASGSALIYATYIGGAGYDIGQSMAVDAAGNAIIVGSTGSNNFPLAANIQRIPQGGAEAFVTKLDPTGTKFLFSTFLGGFGNDEATAVAVDGQGNIYIAGNSEAQGFPVTPQSPYTPPPASRTLSSVNGTVVSGAFVLKISDSGPATPVVFRDGVTSVAGYDFGPVTAGQIVDLIGTNLGPLNSAVLTLDAEGRVSRTLAGVEVDFDGVAAPLVFVTSDDARAVVPVSVAGKSSVQVVVKTPAGASPAVTLPVVPASPAQFTLGPQPTLQGAIVNQDGTVNSPQNPTARGSIVSLYGAGFGPTIPALEDGRVYTSNLPVLVFPVAVTIGGAAAEIHYAGQAYGLVAGVMLINVRISPQAQTGPNQPVIVNAGPYTTPRPVQIAIR
ncbi:MAG: SBBP repeat-containing protein [Acidobacteriota bacterium]|nr:SBBP repeat-containing protein [Acidobacteriota bacterium]